MRRALLVAAVLGALLWPAVAEASVRVRISKSMQTMHVYVNGSLAHVWPVSTARSGYSTPSGTYRPQRLARRWYSSKYHGSPMPYSIFFRGGYAIHGTGEVGRLGRRASHGCIRLAPVNAAQLFSLVQQYGPARTRIVVSN